MTVSEDKRAIDLAALILSVCHDAGESPRVVITAIVCACAWAMHASDCPREVVNELLDRTTDRTAVS